MKHKSDIWTHPEPVTMVVTPPRRKQSHYVVSVTFVIAILATMYYIGDAIYNYGFIHGQAAKVCASVPGEKVVSTTADTCTYANAYGRATKTRRAM